MSKFYRIYDWMHKKLELKNSMLLAFAYLYDRADYYDQYYHGMTWKYTAKEVSKNTGISERNARRVLNILHQQSIIKMTVVKNKNIVNVYWVDKKEIIKKINNHEKMGS